MSEVGTIITIKYVRGNGGTENLNAWLKFTQMG